MSYNGFADRAGGMPEAEPTDNSVNYLRQLKAQTPAENTRPAAPTPPATGDRSGPAPGKERRRSPRYKCAGSAELTQDGTHVRTWGTLTDISLRGCYVEMNTTLPVDTKVEMVLEAQGFRFRAHGIVRITYPFLGMGILLSAIEADQRTLLEQLLATLARATTVTNPLVEGGQSAADAILAADPVAVCNEIRSHFERNSSLSRVDFIRIAERCRRP